MSNTRAPGGFNYQTQENSLLGAIEELRMPGMDSLPDYMRTLSGDMAPMGVPMPAVQPATDESDEDDDEPSEDELEGLAELEEHFDAADAGDDDLGFSGFGQFDDLRIEEMLSGGYADDDEEEDDGLGGLGALGGVVAGSDLEAIKTASAAYNANLKIKDVIAFLQFKQFGRSLGNREPTGIVLAQVVKLDTGIESNWYGASKEVEKEVTTVTDIRVPAAVLEKYRHIISNMPSAEALALVRQRGQAMTDQEIQTELAKKQSQAAQTAKDNALASQQARGAAKPAAKRGADPTPKKAVSSVDADAAAANIRSAAKLGWQVDRSKYDGGAGDLGLVRDARVFQKSAKLSADGKIGPGTLKALDAVQSKITSQGRAARVDPSILTFVNAIAIKGSSFGRSAGVEHGVAPAPAPKPKPKPAPGPGPAPGPNGGGLVFVRPPVGPQVLPFNQPTPPDVVPAPPKSNTALYVAGGVGVLAVLGMAYMASKGGAADGVDGDVPDVGALDD